MKTVWRFLVAFLALTGAVAVLTGVFGVEFGNANYWDYHGVFLLVFLTMFPRLTLLLSSIPSGGLLWWLSWLFAPRLLVAVLATLGYWKSNPILVIISWLIAVGGESSEKYVVIQRTPFRTRREPPEGGSGSFESAKWVKSDVREPK